MHGIVVVSRDEAFVAALRLRLAAHHYFVAAVADWGSLTAMTMGVAARFVVIDAHSGLAGSDWQQLTDNRPTIIVRGGHDANVDHQQQTTEALAFIEQLCGHSEPARRPAQSHVLRIGGLEVDRDRWRVDLDGEAISLSTREFQLLTYVMSRPEVVLTREQIIESVWGDDFPGTDRVVDVHFSRLRRRLLDLPNCPISIRAVPGIGYKLVVRRDERQLAGISA